MELLIVKYKILQIIGRGVQLEIWFNEHQCINDKCEIASVTKNFGGFLNIYRRMTERCADFICTLVLETSFEGCTHICRAFVFKTSGDTVIRLL